MLGRISSCTYSSKSNISISIDTQTLNKQVGNLLKFHLNGSSGSPITVGIGLPDDPLR